MTFRRGLKHGLVYGLGLGTAFFAAVNPYLPAPDIRANPALLLTDQFFDALRHVESSGRTNARNPRSGAYGPDQFIPTTFLEQVYKHCPHLGCGDLARKIIRKPLYAKNDGRRQLVGYEYTAKNIKTLKDILERRADPVLSRKLTRAYVAENMTRVNDVVIKHFDSWTPTKIYFTHKMGATGARRMFTALATAPDTQMAAIAGPGVCARNPVLCKDGRTVAEAYAVFEERLESAPVPGVN